MAIAAAAGWNTYALGSDGTVWAWGDNEFGQLGDSSSGFSRVPVQVPGLTGAKAIAAGRTSAYALMADGRVWGWGDNLESQLGPQAAESAATTPVEITGLAEVVSLAVGDHVGYALTRDGSVWAWGTNGAGELGDGSGESPKRTQPGKVTFAGPVAVATMAADSGSAFAVASGGQLWAWGKDECGLSGLGDRPGGSLSP